MLHQPYEADKARLVLREMADLLSMDLVDKGFVTNQLVVTIGYDIENLTDPERRRKYRGEVVKDHYGRQIPAGTIRFDLYRSEAPCPKSSQRSRRKLHRRPKRISGGTG